MKDDSFEVRGKAVINASGPLVQQLLENLDLRQHAPLLVTEHLYLDSNHPLHPKYAPAIPGQKEVQKASVSRGKGHFCVIPWRGRAMIGSSQVPYEGDADKWEVMEKEIGELSEDLNAAYTPLQLTRKNVSMQKFGLVPGGNHYGSRSRVHRSRSKSWVVGAHQPTSVARKRRPGGVADKTIDLSKCARHRLRYLQRELVRKYLPPEVVTPQKQGFGIPLRYWFQGELGAVAEKILGNSSLAQAGCLSQSGILSLLEEYRQQGIDHSHRLWMLLNLEMWHRVFINKGHSRTTSLSLPLAVAELRPEEVLGRQP